MSLEEQFQEDLKSAMKSGDETAVSVLRLLRTRLKEASVAKRDDLSEDEIYKAIATEIKKRKEAIELFEKGGRSDLAAREHKEIEILDGYDAGGYGAVDDGVLDTIRRFAREGGVILDPVYSGKAAMGLIGDLERGYIRSGDRVLFIHTGGIYGLLSHHRLFSADVSP